MVRESITLDPVLVGFGLRAGLAWGTGLDFGEGTRGVGRALEDAAAEVEGFVEGLQVGVGGFVGEEAEVDLGGLGRVFASQADGAGGASRAAHGVHLCEVEGPGVGAAEGEVSNGCVPGKSELRVVGVEAAECKVSAEKEEVVFFLYCLRGLEEKSKDSASVDVGSFAVKPLLEAGVGGGVVGECASCGFEVGEEVGRVVDDGLLVVVLEVGADVLVGDEDRDLEGFEVALGTDAGKHEELGGVEGTGGEDNFLAGIVGGLGALLGGVVLGIRLVDVLALERLDTNSLLGALLKDNLGGERGGQERQWVLLFSPSILLRLHLLEPIPRVVPASKLVAVGVDGEESFGEVAAGIRDVVNVSADKLAVVGRGLAELFNHMLEENLLVGRRVLVVELWGRRVDSEPGAELRVVLRNLVVPVIGERVHERKSGMAYLQLLSPVILAIMSQSLRLGIMEHMALMELLPPSVAPRG